jgi:TonB-linked SusC/RagA family outer membrane protein
MKQSFSFSGFRHNYKWAIKENIAGLFFFKRHLLLASLFLYTFQGYAQHNGGKDTLSEIADAPALVQLNVPGKDSVVPMLYNMKSPAHLNIASIRSISGEKLASMPGNQLKGVLAGLLPGLFVNQSSSNSGTTNESAFSLSLRGQSPLIVIDGIPQNISIFDFEEIESVSVLSDALATAMYGPQASNGVLLITSKKGEIGKQRIRASWQSSIQKPGKFLRGLNAYDYATLYNEALANDGIEPVYTPADLDAYKNHTDPYGHPDIDWTDLAYKNTTRMDRVTMNVTGGNKVARYFAVGEYLHQGGIFNTNKDENTYNTNNDFSSYMLRTNVDVNLDQRTVVGINVLGRVIESSQPGPTTNTIRNSIYNTPNNAYPRFNPDGSLGGVLEFKDNTYGQLNRSGYRQGYERNVLSDVSLKRNLDNIVNGLWVKGLVSFSGAFVQNINRSKTFAVYQMNVMPNETSGLNDTTYRRFNSDGEQNNTDAIADQWIQSYTEFDLGYDRKFGKHGFNGLLLYNSISTRINSNLPLRFKGISGRVAYNYDEKYMAEAVFGYNGFNRYPEGFRLRFFPAVGLGWNIHKEQFFENVSWVDRLKLYGSYGKTGNDGNGYYSFKQYYVGGTSVYFGTTPSSNATVAEGALANPHLDYEKAGKLNLGIEGAVLKSRLYFSFEYYINNYYNLIRTRGTSITIIGNSYPAENLGKSRYSGLNMLVGYNGKSGSSFFYNVSANANIAKSKVVFIDEVDQPYAWMRRTGGQVGQAFGYTAVGLYRTPQDFNRPGVATIDGYTPQLGDIMYKDYDMDGRITVYDEAPIGTTKPLVFFGSDIHLAYKGFDFRALLQGALHRNITLTGASQWEFQNRGLGQAFEHHLDRWTPDNPNASYPRLTVGTNINNHISNSSYWYKDGSYGRLKFLELGYNISGNWTRNIRIESFRIFTNATNLFTASAYKGVDPEVYGYVYPIVKTFSGGLTINF